MPNSPLTKSSVRQLIVAYISAALVLVLLLTLAQGIIQYTLFQEMLDRQVYALIAGQGIASEHLQRDALLLLVPGDHSTTVKEMQADIDTLERNHAQYAAQYSTLFPQINQKPGTPNPYVAVAENARGILGIETQTGLTAKQKRTQETPRISALFYAGNAYLVRVEAVITLIEASTDAYIVLIHWTELILYGLTLLTMLAELLFVIRPALRDLREQMKLIAESIGEGKTVL